MERMNIKKKSNARRFVLERSKKKWLYESNGNGRTVRPQNQQENKFTPEKKTEAVKSVDQMKIRFNCKNSN